MFFLLTFFFMQFGLVNYYIFVILVPPLQIFLMHARGYISDIHPPYIPPPSLCKPFYVTIPLYLKLVQQDNNILPYIFSSQPHVQI